MLNGQNVTFFLIFRLPGGVVITCRNRQAEKTNDKTAVFLVYSTVPAKPVERRSAGVACTEPSVYHRTIDY